MKMEDNRMDLEDLRGICLILHFDTDILYNKVNIHQ